MRNNKLLLTLMILTLFLMLSVGCSPSDAQDAPEIQETENSNEEEESEQPDAAIEEDPIEEEEDVIEEDDEEPTEESKTDTDGELSVHFIDVGQGNAVFIRQGSQSMLIDAGDNHMASRVVDYLRKEGIEKVDYLIGTHPHADHIGGMEDVMDHFDVGKVFMPDVTHTTRTFENTLLAIQRNDLRITKPVVGDVYQIGAAKVTIIAPHSSSYSNLNDYSIGIRLDYGTTSFLFTGDAERRSEEEMVANRNNLSLDVDVILVPHHGSNSSSTRAFLEAASPQYGVIQLGADNRYGHPHTEVIERLQQYNIETYRNDLHGHVVFLSDGTTIRVQTEKTPKEANAPPAEESGTGDAPDEKQETSTPTGGVNINTASIDELQEIIHVGPAYAEQIIALRPFQSVNDLTRVKGIGDGRIKDIKEQGIAYVD